MIRPVIYIVCLLISISCSNREVDISAEKPYHWDLPEGFSEPVAPADNQMTVERVALGKKLFYDPILSVDSSVSCGSCHKAAAGFADELAISPGIKNRKGFRNSPTLTNIAYHPYFFKEGGSPSLELQVLGPIENEDEMGFNAALLAERLKGHPEYDALAQEAYGRNMDLFVLVRAIASFERTLISGNAPYDRFRMGEKHALSAAQIRGMELFFSDRTKCVTCHAGIDFSTYKIENNGLYNTFNDKGRHRVTLDEADIGKFKIPSLRNVALTAPYMHDGSLFSLGDVIDHYQSGGKGHPNQHENIRPFSLDENEKADLISFLHALTDEEFIKNPAFRP